MALTIDETELVRFWIQRPENRLHYGPNPTEADEPDLFRDCGVMLDFARDLMERYLGGAAALDRVPETVANQAALRIVGYETDRTRNPARIETTRSGQTPGPGAVRPTIQGHLADPAYSLSPLRYSGAMALLSPFKRRRAL